MTAGTNKRHAAESAIAIGTCLLDRRTGAMSWSDDLVRELGVPGHDGPETLGGRAALEAEPDAYKDLLGFERADDGSTLSFHVPTATGDTRLLRLDALTLPPEVGEQYQLWAAFDLTQYQENLDRLEHSESLLLHSQRIANLGCWSLNMRTQVLEWSDQLYTLTGVSPEVAPTVELFHSLVHPDDCQWVVSGAQEALGSGETSPREFRLLRASDGAERWVLEWCSPVLDGDGDVSMFVGTLQDITERKELERQLVQSQKMDAIGRLAGGIAHDFNNMLTVIQGYLELLRLDGDREEYQRMSEATGQAAELTSKLLSFSRHMVHRHEAVDLHAVIGQATGLIERIIGEDITLRQDLSPQPCWVEADAGNLQQMIMNLLLNARDAMPDGGDVTITTSIQTLARKNAVGAPGVTGSFIRLDIQDTGCGMDELTRSRVFEPFFTTKETGNGLGLATVFGGVAQLGGFVELESEEGIGTVFSLFFPATKAPADRRPKPAAHDVVAADHAGRILVVEDEPAIRTLLDAALSRAGYSVLLASRPREAEAIWQEHSREIDLIITDMVMPDMNGFALISRLRKTRPRIPVILMTGYAPDPASAPPDATIVLKPFRPQDLLVIVSASLGS